MKRTKGASRLRDGGIRYLREVGGDRNAKEKSADGWICLEASHMKHKRESGV